MKHYDDELHWNTTGDTHPPLYDHPLRYKICRDCGTHWLAWRMTNADWRLHNESGALPTCPRPLDRSP